MVDVAGLLFFCFRRRLSLKMGARARARVYVLCYFYLHLPRYPADQQVDVRRRGHNNVTNAFLIRTL